MEQMIEQLMEMQVSKRDKNREYYFPDRLKGLAQAIPKYPLIIVEAPMGYGKTTIVNEAIQRYTANLNPKTCWVHLHESDLEVFWMRLCQALALISSDQTAALAEDLKKCSFPITDQQRYHTTQILAQIAKPGRLILVIDDYHNIASQTTNTWLSHMVSQQIKNLTVILTTRHIDLHNTQELEIKGLLLHIHQRQLSLSPQEIMAYYKHCGVKITLTHATDLHNHTQGWISALYLKLLNYKATGDLQSHDSMHQLIGSALYQNLPPRDRQNLLALTFCDNLEVKHIPQLIKDDHNRAMQWLQQISRQNAFIEYREHTQQVSLHAILRGYLTTQFDQQEAHIKRELHLRYAQIYRNPSDYQPLRALHHHYLAGDFTGLMHTLTEDRGHAIRLGQIATINTYFDACPTRVLIENPCAQLVYAMCLFTFNDMERFQKACETFAQIMTCQSDPESPRNAHLMGEFQLLLAFTKYNDIHAMHENILAAQALMTGPAQFVDTQSSWTFGAPSVLYMFHRAPGTLNDTVSSLKFTIGAYSKITNGHGCGGDALILGETFFNRGDFTSAQIEAHRATVKAQHHKQSDIVLCAAFLQLRIATALGQGAEAEKILTTIQSTLTNGANYHLQSTLELCEAFVNVTANENHIAHWIETCDVINSNLYFPAIGFLHIVYGRNLINNAHYTKLLGEAEQILQMADVFSSLLTKIYIKIYMAIASAKVFREEAALNYLKEALQMAIPDQLYMPFVENKVHLSLLLEVLEQGGYERSAIQMIQGLGQLAEKGITKTQNTHEKTKASLTSREYEIACMAAQGFTNNQIGDKLYISPNTVKMALKSIFAKLDIHHRSHLAAKLPIG